MTFTAENSYEIDFTGDLRANVNGQYSILDNQIIFVDTGGTQVCPDTGFYGYRVQEDQLTFSLVRDGCDARARPLRGAWTQKGALEKFTKAIQADPQDAEVYMKRGDVRFILLDAQGSYDDYQKVIELDPDHAGAYAGRAAVRSVFWKNYQAAITDFNKALELDPEDEVAYFSRGLAKFYLDDLDGACGDWKKSLELGHTQAHGIVIRYCQ
jgi:tetratricopeptide (TPR) repeat protein